MAFVFDLEREEREERLTAVVRAAGFERSTVFVSEQPPKERPEGYHWLSGPDVDIFVASWLIDPDAEATALHEQAHVELDHDDDAVSMAATGSRSIPTRRPRSTTIGGHGRSRPTPWRLRWSKRSLTG
jgi:hypothetical protein